MHMGFIQSFILIMWYAEAVAIFLCGLRVSIDVIRDYKAFFANYINLRIPFLITTNKIEHNYL